MGASVVAYCVFIAYALLALTAYQITDAALSRETQKSINKANEHGPYLGLVIPNTFEMNPLLQSPNFTSTDLIIDFSGEHKHTYQPITMKFNCVPFHGCVSLCVCIFLSDSVTIYTYKTLMLPRTQYMMNLNVP